MKNPITGFGTYKKRNGETIVLNAMSQTYYYNKESSCFKYDTLSQGNMVLPYIEEHPEDIIEKLSDSY